MTRRLPPPRSQTGSSSIPSARALALTALDWIERRQSYADEAMDRATGRLRLEPKDRALMMELVYGVLRRRLALDWRLDHVADRPMERLPAAVANALRLGAYQCLYLTKIPHSVAVHETVAMIRRRLRSPHWTGFTNAVLRALLRSSPPSMPALSEAPVPHLSITYSCPTWLVERWVERFGLVSAEQVCRETCHEPPMTLCVNRMRLTREELLRSFSAGGLAAAATVLSPDGVHVDKCGSPIRLPHFDDGGFYVEDEAAQLIPLLLSPEPGERILDACAAPGGKSLHCAALMAGRGEIVAVDRSVERLNLVTANSRRLGAAMIQPVRHDWEAPATSVPPPLRAPFDRVLLDAPCSALGVLRRHPEGKWQKQAARLEHHQLVQRHLLETTSRLLRPGGVIVYSTCSTEPEETVQVIDRFCEAHPDFKRESVAPWLPPAALPLVTDRGEFCSVLNEQGMDAFFAARLTRLYP